MTPNERSALLVASALAGVLLLILAGCQTLGGVVGCIACEAIGPLETAYDAAVAAGDLEGAALILPVLATTRAECRVSPCGPLTPLLAQQIEESLAIGDLAAAKLAAPEAFRTREPDALTLAVRDLVRQQWTKHRADYDRNQAWAPELWSLIDAQQEPQMCGDLRKEAEVQWLEARLAQTHVRPVCRRRSWGGGGPSGWQFASSGPIRSLVFSLNYTPEGEALRATIPGRCGR